METYSGSAGVVIVAFSVNAPLGLPNRTDKVFVLLKATTISGDPSPFRSPTATDVGAAETGTFETSLNVPSPLPCMMDSVFSSVLAVTRSGKPSLLKSATASADGYCPVVAAAETLRPITVFAGLNVAEPRTTAGAPLIESLKVRVPPI